MLLLEVFAGTLMAGNLIFIMMFCVEYFGSSRARENPVSKLYALRLIVITGAIGYITSEEDDGIFWRRIYARADAAKSNADQIADARRLVARLREQPNTDEVMSAIAQACEDLAALRKHDEFVRANVALGGLQKDRQAVSDAVKASKNTQSDTRHLTA